MRRRRHAERAATHNATELTVDMRIPCQILLLGVLGGGNLCLAAPGSPPDPAASGTVSAHTASTSLEQDKIR